MENIKKYMNTFLESNFYIPFIASVNFFAWILGVPLVAIIPYTLVAIYVLLFTDRIEYFFVMLMFMIMLRSPYNESGKSFVEEQIFFYVCISIPLIYFGIKNFEKKFNFNFAIGLLSLVIANFLSYISLIGSGEINLAVLSTMFSIPQVILLYFFASIYIKRDLRNYFAYAMVAMGMLIFLETIVVELLSDLPIDIAKDYGWTIQNGAAQVLVLTIPFTVYFACTSKYSIIYLVLAALQGIALVTTFSRGGILSFGLISIPLLIILLKFLPRKRYLLFLTPGLLALFVPNLIEQMLDMIITEGNTDNGRYNLYHLGIDFFLESPLFGRTSLAFYEDLGSSSYGIFSVNDGSQFVQVNFHNTFLHILATMGIIGAIALIIHIGELYKKITSHKDLFMIIVAIALIGANIHGMLDMLYFKWQMWHILPFLFAVIDNSYPKVNNPKTTHT